MPNAHTHVSTRSNTQPVDRQKYKNCCPVIPLKKQGGVFRGNEAMNGGVAFVGSDATLLVEGGSYHWNLAENGGGVFNGEEDGHIFVSSGKRNWSWSWGGGGITE